MCQKPSWLSAFVIVTLCASYVATGPTSLQAQQVVVRGSIESSDGVPLPGSVTIVEGTRDLRVNTYTTSESGEFEFATSWEAQKRVVAKADGFVSDEAVISIDPRQREVTHRFTLDRPATVSGRVVDQSGAPVPDATVRVRYVDENRSLLFTQEVGAVKSDGFGYFVLPIVARGKQFVVDAVSAEHPLSSSSPLLTQSDTLSNVVVSMDRLGYPVTGRIVNVSGQPLVDARVRLLATGDGEPYSQAERASVSFTATGAKVAVTDDQGFFAFDGVPSGKIVLIVQTTHGRIREEAIVNHTPLSVDVVVPWAQ